MYSLESLGKFPPKSLVSKDNLKIFVSHPIAFLSPGPRKHLLISPNLFYFIKGNILCPFKLSPVYGKLAYTLFLTIACLL